MLSRSSSSVLEGVVVAAFRPFVAEASVTMNLRKRDPGCLAAAAAAAAASAAAACDEEEEEETFSLEPVAGMESAMAPRAAPTATEPARDSLE